MNESSELMQNERRMPRVSMHPLKKPLAVVEGPFPLIPTASDGLRYYEVLFDGRPAR